MKAWLITWAWDSESQAKADKVIGILNPRLSEEKIKFLLEFLFMQATSGLEEMATFAKDNRQNPDRAKTSNSRVVCGTHPRLEARKVDDLIIKRDPSKETEIIEWSELPLFEFVEDEGIKEVRGKLKRSFSRRIEGPVSNESIWDRAKGDYKDWWLDLGK